MKIAKENTSDPEGRRQGHGDQIGDHTIIRNTIIAISGTNSEMSSCLPEEELY